MNEQKNLLIVLGEWWQQRQTHRNENRRSIWQTWFPSRGNVIFTLAMIAILLWAQTAGAVPFLSERAASTGTIAYQGRLADSGGNPLTTTVNMTFRLYNTATGGTPLWAEDWTGPNGVQVSDGLFNVMLGSLTAIPQNVITGNPTLFLGITAGTDDEMAPRVQLGSVPFAVQALTVPNNSVTTEKLADKSVTQAKLGPDISLVPPAGSISESMLADKSVSSRKLNITAEQAGYGPCCVTLTSTAQILPGTKRSIVVTVPSRLFVWLTFDFSLPGTLTTAVGKLQLDGQPTGREAILTGSSIRATVGSAYAIDIEPGTHIAELIALSDGATTVFHHTGYSYMVVAR